MNEVEPTGRCGGARRRMVTGALALLIALPALNILTETVAAAAPVLVQTAAGQNSNSSLNSTVNLSATLGSPCSAGDTLIAMITIGQQNDAGGMVSVTPPGWQRLFEHSPVDTSPYQGWFALSNCGGVSTASFSVTARSDSSGTAASIVLDEFSGLPNPVTEDGSNNGGSSSSSTSDSLTAPTPSASGELTLAALSFYGSSPNSTTPSGWTAAGSETSTLPTFNYWRVGNASAPSANFSWSPSAAFEVTMLTLKAGPASPAPNVVQENQGGFSGQTSWGVTLPSSVSAGDSLVAMVGTNASTSTAAGFEANSVSGGGVTWQQVTGYKQSGNGTAEIWVGFASTGTSGATPVTASMSGSLSGQMVVSEVTNISSIDAASAAHGTGSTDTASSITPHAGDLLVGMLTANPSALVTHPMPNWSTFSLAAASYGTEWLTNAPAAATAPQWSTSSSGNYIALQAAFTVKTAGGSSGISSVGTTSGAAAKGTSTLAVAPKQLGDVLVLLVKVDSSTIKATSVSGGGVGSWSQAATYAGYSTHQFSIWIGTVTSTGSATITVGFSASPSAVEVGLEGQEFSSALGTSTVWGIDTSGGISNASGSTTTFTALTPAGSGELYAGFNSVSNGNASAGSTPGFTYSVTPDGDIVAFDTAVSAKVQPTAPQSPANVSGGIAVLLTASSSTAPGLPTVTGISPTSGPTAGATSVIITGTNLSGATAVKFGTAAGTITADSATSITVTSPAGTGTVDVTVTTPSGTSATSPADQFTYVAPSLPTVTGISPTSGPTSGATSVIITGTNLSGATAVKFGTAAGTITADSATSITVTSPAGTGTVDVTVTTPSGTSATSSADLFTYTSSSGATISSVGTTSGAAAKGTSTLAVAPKQLGDVLVLLVKVDSSTIKATSVSGGGVGSWSQAATYAGYSTHQFSIWIGTVTSTGSATITVGFSASPSAVEVGLEGQEFSSALGTSTVWGIDTSGGISNASGSTTTFTALTPAGSGELYAGFNSVSNGNASAGSTPGFTYSVTPDGDIVAFDTAVSAKVQPTAPQSPANVSGGIAVLLTASSSTAPGLPTVTGISPTSGPTAGATSVIITGTNLSGATAVKFGTAAGTITADSATSITVTSPAGTGTVDVTVTTPSGTSATSPADQFTYVAPSLPTVTGISPTSGPTSGATSVIITGTNLSGATAVKFGTAAGTITADSATSITVTSPAGTGTVDVTVTTPSGTSATSPADQFTYVAPSLPTVTGISPTSGPTSGATSVIITGTNLSGATAVKFGTAAGTITADSATSITVTSPAGTGTVDVTVTTPSGTSATSPADQFTYVAPSLPTVTGISPTSGPTSGATSVIITGTNLSGATAVKFGTAAGTITADSATSITVTSPAGTGTVDVTVTTPSGTSATSPADQFTYVAPSLPTVTGISPTSGPTSGATSVIITGTNLSGATAVKFGTAAGTITADSATSITVTSPAGTGTVDVTVTTPSGTSATSSADLFTYTSSSGATISSVGTLFNGDSVGLTTLAVSPVNVGDVMVLAVRPFSPTITVTSVSGGGASTWTKLSQHTDTTDGVDVELWMGTVTTTGPSTITVTFSASVTSTTVELGSQEFSSGLGPSTVWTADGSGGQTNASSTTVGFPKLTPTGTSELYVGYAWVAQTGAAGTTSGTSYDVLPKSKDVFLYDPTVSSALTPGATQSPKGTSTSVGALLKATS